MARPSDVHAKIDLLRAAEQVFVESGLEKARVEDITARAGRSKGSFYLHFESKEDAFRQIVESFLARLAAMIDCPPDPNGDFEAVVETWHEKDVELFEYFWQNRAVAKLLLHGGSSAQFRYMIDAFADRARINCKMLVEIGKERGYYRADVDADVAALVIAGAYDRVVRELVEASKKPNVRAWLGAMQDLLLRGLASKPAPLRHHTRNS
jgi:AcrR family transcriptional regulator